MKTRNTLTPYLFLLPALALYGVLVLYPLASSLSLTLYSWDGLSQKVFVGLANFQYALSRDPVFVVSLINNIKWTIAAELLPVTLGLVLAAVFNIRMRGMGAFRSIIFFPTTLSLVTIGFIWTCMYNPIFGLVPNLLKAVSGGRIVFDWYANTSVVIYYVVVAASWGYTGICMIMFLAGLQAIPNELLEAARIDGASARQTFFRITIPQLQYTLNVVVIFTLINSFKVFDIIFVMTRGGPGRSTNVLASWAYSQMFIYHELGKGSSVAWLLTLIVLAISIVYNQVLYRRRSEP